MKYQTKINLLFIGYILATLLLSDTLPSSVLAAGSDKEFYDSSRSVDTVLWWKQCIGAAGYQNSAQTRSLVTGDGTQAQILAECWKYNGTKWVYVWGDVCFAELTRTRYIHSYRLDLSCRTGE